MVLKILAFILVLIGGCMVYLAGMIVKKYKLDQKATCNIESELSEQEIVEYKENKAIIKVKLFGLMILLPGIIILLFIFKS